RSQPSWRGFAYPFLTPHCRRSLLIQYGLGTRGNTARSDFCTAAPATFDITTTSQRGTRANTALRSLARAVITDDSLVHRAPSCNPHLMRVLPASIASTFTLRSCAN